MTATVQSSTATDVASLRAEFAELFALINTGAVQREQDHQLPFEQVNLLKEAGFTRLRVPVEFGGRGVELEVFLELFLELATADSNVAHLLRGHVAHLESLLLRAPSEYRSIWLRRLGNGELIGNAASERGELTEISTVLREDAGELRVSGTKYYTTGSIYADWISLSAVRGDQRVNLLVRANTPGVKITDDWDGFGQQLTGSGSLILDNVPVAPEDITIFDSEDQHLGFRVGLFQTILLLVAAGIAQSAVNDAVNFVKPRKRTFAIFGETTPATEPIVQTVIGEAAAKAYSAGAIVLSLATKFSRYSTTGGASQSSESLALEVFKAQQVVLNLATTTATEIFEVGGASATSTTRGLDRHWRNARTVASHNPAKYRARLVGEQLLTGQFELYAKRP